MKKSPPKLRLLVIPGMPKSGTSFLYKSIMENDKTFATLDSKEPNIFGRTSLTERDIEEISLAGDSAMWTVDATPVYIYQPVVAERMATVRNPGDEIKFVVCLRQRVDQVFSWYIHHAIHHLIFDLWEKNGFAQTVPHQLSITNPSPHFLFAPIFPFLNRLIQDFGQENILVFNHHLDYNEESPFWKNISDFLGTPIEKHATFFWTQNELPAVLYFEANETREIDGVVVSFRKGDLVIATKKKTKLYRNIEAATGRRVVSHLGALTRSLTNGTISSIQSIVEDDFNRSLDALGISEQEFPGPTEKHTTTTPVNVNDLVELQREPVRIISQP
jgi:hypothetical protein